MWRKKIFGIESTHYIISNLIYFLFLYVGYSYSSTPAWNPPTYFGKCVFLFVFFCFLAMQIKDKLVGKLVQRWMTLRTVLWHFWSTDFSYISLLPLFAISLLWERGGPLFPKQRNWKINNKKSLYYSLFEKDLRTDIFGPQMARESHWF